MSANDRQVAGEHYKGTIQHWDFVVAQNLDYFQAQITKYVSRHKKKNGLQDLEKAKHFLEKYIEVVQSAENENVFGGGPTSAYVNQE
jgi:lipopolysaccharide biosynthesis regulator YciM